MKKIILYLCLPLALMQIKCGETFEDGFEMNYFKDFEIFAGLNTLETHIFELTIPSQKESFFQANGVTEADVTSILPKSFRLTALGGNATYDILERIRLDILKTDGTLEREIAFREPVPLDTGFEIDLIPTLAEATEHLKENSYVLRVKLNFRQVPSQSIDTRMTIRFQALSE